jgi:hypothetical protein
VLGIEDCVTEVLSIPGALGVIIVDHMSGMAVSRGGDWQHTDVDRSAAALSETLRAALDGLAITSPGGTVRVDDVIIASDRGHHLLKPVETVFEGPLLICLRLDLERSNIALARHRLRAITSRLGTG